MERRTGLYAFFAMVVAGGSVSAADCVIDLALARSYFDEAAAMSNRDGGSLWGRPLYGPMLFVDPASRMVVANEADRNSALEPDGDVFVGSWSEKINIANTTVVWSGKLWAQIRWPLPESLNPRAVLLGHAMWHRIQDQIGLSRKDANNGHLDTPDGRIWMRLEWRAWSRAIGATGADRREAVGDALAFRAMRRLLCRGASDAERAMENNEGLAEYTGVVLAGWNGSERIKHIQNDLVEAEQSDYFVWSFADHTGPVIGVLLDETLPNWRRHYNRSNELPARLRVALRITRPKDLPAFAEARSSVYGGKKIREEERIREGRRQQRLAAARAKFIDGPTLRIRLVNMNMQFDPRTLRPLDDVGTVYPALRITDVWGTLEVEDGALLAADRKSVTVPVAPDWDGKVTRRKNAWRLNIEWPWRIERARKKGNWVLTR